MKAHIPSFFSFKQAEDLVRLGRDNDGGYLVSQSDIDKSDILISLGICDDWSFEKDFLSYKKIDVHAYDGSVSSEYFFKQIIKNILRIDNLKICFHWIKTLFEYKKFFSKPNNKHIKKFVGLNSESSNHCTFLDVINGKNNKNIFLKVDIEGSEYRFLDDIVENVDKITGMVIEFHNCDIHIKEIKRFLSNFSLNLVHIHANNMALIRLEDSLPLVLELTFSRHAKVKESFGLPHKLDMPNTKIVEEYELVVDK